jgi:glycosyltransferase involved in cell wall biosynthesis
VAKHLAEAGHEVTVWAARRHHILARPCGEIPNAESCESGAYRFKTVETPFYKGNGWGRMKNMMAFSFGMSRVFKASVKEGQAPDLLIVSSPQLLVWPWLERSALGKSKLIFEERDIWPESLVELAGVSQHHPLVWYMSRIMRSVGRKADGVVSLLPETRERFEKMGLPPNRWAWIPNGIDFSEIQEGDAATPPSYHTSALNAARDAGKLVVLYAGSMGPPNALENVLALADGFEPKKYKFFLMGDGVSRAELEKQAQARRLDFIEFLPQVTRKESWQVMKTADIGFFCIKNSELFINYGLSPNKILDYFSQKLPIVGFYNSKYDPIRLSGGGFSIKNNNYEELHNTLNKIATLNKQTISEIGKKGYDFIVKNNSWDYLGIQYSNFCDKILNS